MDIVKPVEKGKLICAKTRKVICGVALKYMEVNLEIGSAHTLVDWYNFCRDVCIDILVKDNLKIGGPGHFVEIDESKFGRRKYHKGS